LPAVSTASNSSSLKCDYVILVSTGSAVRGFGRFGHGSARARAIAQCA
jgi:hypothetical protein